jgi:hypothetical protein
LKRLGSFRGKGEKSPVMNFHTSMTVLSVGLALLLYWLRGCLTLYGMGLNHNRRVGRTLASVVTSLNIVPNSVATPSGLIQLRLSPWVFLGKALTLGIAGENLRRSRAQAVTLRTRVAVDPASRPVACRASILLAPAALGLFGFDITRPAPVFDVNHVWKGLKAPVRIAIVPGV